MNITFDPLNRDERSVVLALLGNLEAPGQDNVSYSGAAVQALLAANPPVAATPPAAPPPRTRKKKDEAPAISAGTAALNPALVDTSTKLPEVAAAIKTVAENVPEPFVPAPLAPLKAPELTKEQEALLAAPLKAVPSIGDLLANSTTPPPALTRDDMRDLLSTYAAKGPEESKFATSQLAGCMFKLSLLLPENYPAVAAALAEKGWTLDQARAAVAAKKAGG